MHIALFRDPFFRFKINTDNKLINQQEDTTKKRNGIFVEMRFQCEIPAKKLSFTDSGCK